MTSLPLQALPALLSCLFGALALASPARAGGASAAVVDASDPAALLDSEPTAAGRRAASTGEWRAGDEAGGWAWRPESVLRWQQGAASMLLSWRPAAAAWLPGTASGVPTGAARLGFGLATGPHSRLSVDAPLWVDARIGSTGRPLRFALTVAPADPWAGLGRGQLTKIELSAQRQLSLRTRGGGLALTYSQRY